MISDIRTVFIAKVKAVDSTFTEWKDAFNFENIPATKFNKSFHIAYSVPNIEKMQTTTVDEIELTLKLFFAGARDTQTALDNAMDLAHLIRLNCISLSGIPDGYLSIDSTSIVPEPLDTNDNKIIVTLTFTAKKYFTNC